MKNPYYGKSDIRFKNRSDLFLKSVIKPDIKHKGG